MLTQSAWEHIVRRHPEISSFERELLHAVAWPDVITPDNRLNRWRYWVRGVGPSRWMLIVVGWSTRPAHVITAHGERRDPI